MTLERYGVRGSEAHGVFFTESTTIDGAQALGEVNVKVGGQNKDIRDVKRALAKEVLKKGGNALVAFKYGQQGNSWWQSFGLVDSEHWYGSGVAVLVRQL